MSAAAQVADDFALRIEHLGVSIGGAPILTDVSFTPAVGQLNAVIGPNGAGKTTLLRAILGLLPYSGTIEIGRNADGRPLRMAYVPQRLDFDHGMPMSVYDLLCGGLQRRPVWLGHTKTSRRMAQECLARVGGADWGGQRLGALSGGELQRVLLALALTCEPAVLLLDEPVSGVDIAGEQLFCDLLGSLQDTGKYTMLLVSHDLSIVTQHTQYVLCLNRTVQCQGATVETLTADNLQALYRQDAALYGHTGEHEGHAHDHHHHHAH